MHGLLHPCDVEFDRLYDKLDRTLKNLSVDDADETGIHDFETDFLIPLSDDTLELRRSKIKTKFLHTATTTFENLQNIVRAYDNGASISEDNPNYRIKIQSCKPLLLQEILNSVNEIIPAHIATTIDNSHRSIKLLLSVYVQCQKPMKLLDLIIMWLMMEL